MSRPTVEVADLLRTHGDRFVAENRSWLSYQQLKVLRAIQRCRTPALGGHLDHCSGCGHSARSTSAQRLDSSPSYTRGDRTSCSIHISTVSCPSAAFHRTTIVGYDPGIVSFSQSVFSRKSFEASFSRDSNVRIAGTSSVSAVRPRH